MEIRGAELSADQAGDPDAPVDVVWGHGLTQSRRAEDRRPLVRWERVPARVVRYDARGHGESESTEALPGYGWGELARDQLALADHLGIGRYVAGGASMGAATALHAAVLAPERIRALVLAIPPTGWEARAAQAEIHAAGASTIETRGVEPVIAANATVDPPDPLRDDPDHRARGAENLRAWDPVRLARAMRGASGAQLPDREAVATIRCPVLVMGWTGDGAHPVGTIEELARLIPRAEVHVASTAADLATWTDRTSAFVRALVS
ncbi:alpha/beta fold hydrolase [Ilumatobacter sp.]|uniref:alpha/beta fold hydrolase n=1 Tax=Ilumatobacter sp. TaxID=1967498 RepID=UPI003B51D111